MKNYSVRNLFYLGKLFSACSQSDLFETNNFTHFLRFFAWDFFNLEQKAIKVKVVAGKTVPD